MQLVDGTTSIFYDQVFTTSETFLVPAKVACIDKERSARRMAGVTLIKQDFCSGVTTHAQLMIKKDHRVYAKQPAGIEKRESLVSLSNYDQ